MSKKKKIPAWKQATQKYSMADMVRLANFALNEPVKLVTVEGKQMVQIDDKLYDEAGMDKWFSELQEQLAKQGLEVTERGLGRVFRM